MIRRSTRLLLACALPVALVAPASLAGVELPPIPGQTASRTGASDAGGAAGPVKGLAVNGYEFAAFGNGAVVHADALSGAGSRLADVNVALSGAAFSSVPGNEVINEMGRVVTPALDQLPAGYGLGNGLEVGITSAPKPVLGGIAEAVAPPSTELIERSLELIDLPGVLDVELLGAKAQARSAVDPACILGSNLAYGLGSVARAELLGGVLATEAKPPARVISQSSSRTAIVPSDETRLGLLSETRQTIAPLTFFAGTPQQFTIEVLGEWVLRAVADGASGSVHYGPTATTPSTPVLRVLDAQGAQKVSITLQQFLGNDGLEIEIPGVASIVLGEDPRAIGGDAASKPTVTGTLTAAAVDVVRVKLVDGSLADVRVGHMEAGAAVPADGVPCPVLPVTKTVEPAAVAPGAEFTYTIMVTNPNEGTLDKIKVVDTITAQPLDVKYEILSATPDTQAKTATGATWDSVPALAPGATAEFALKLKAAAGEAAGKLVNGVTVAGEYAAPADGPDSGLGVIPVKGEASVDGPEIGPGAGVLTDPSCTVPELIGKTLAEATAAIVAAGCKVGDLTEGGNDPNSKGEVTKQSVAPQTAVPAGTEIDLEIGGPFCTVPAVVGSSEQDARAAVESEGCTLASKPGLASPAEVGKVTTQNPADGTKLPPGSPVEVTIGMARVAAQAGRVSSAAVAAPGTDSDSPALPAALARTGGIALAGLALAVTGTGVVLRLAGRRRRSAG